MRDLNFKVIQETTTNGGMMKEQLLESATALKQPPEFATQEFSQKRDALAAKGNQAIADRSDLEKLVGKGNQQMAEDNNRNFARFMESMFSDYNAGVLVDTVLWVFRAYRSHGFKTTYWAANLNVWVDMLKQTLSKEAFEALYPYYNWLIVNIPIFVKLTDEELTSFDEDSAPVH